MTVRTVPGSTSLRHATAVLYTLIFEDETIDGIALLSASDCKSEKQLCAKACKKLASLIVSEQRAVHIRKPELDVGPLNPLDVADM